MFICHCNREPVTGWTRKKNGRTEIRGVNDKRLVKGRQARE